MRLSPRADKCTLILALFCFLFVTEAAGTGEMYKNIFEKLFTTDDEAQKSAPSSEFECKSAVGVL